MAADNQLNVKIVVDAAQLDAGFKEAAATVDSAARQMSSSMGDAASEIVSHTGKASFSATEARHAFHGLGEEVGLHIPRFVQTFVAHLGGVGPALAAAFAPIAIIGLAKVLVEAGKELFDFYENVVNLKSEFEALDAIEKKLTEDMLSMSNALIQGNTRLTDLMGGAIAGARDRVAALGMQISDLGKTVDVSGKQFNDLGVAAKAALREFLIPTQAKDFTETLKNVGFEIQRVNRLLLQADEGTTEYKSLQEALRALRSFYDVLALKVQKYNQDVAIGARETEKTIQGEQEKTKKEAERLAKERARITHERIIAELNDEERLAKENIHLMEEAARINREFNRNIEEEEKHLDSEIASNRQKSLAEAIRTQEKYMREQERLAREAQRPWLQLGRSITSGFDQMIRGVLQGTQTLGQAFARLGTDMIIIVAEALAKIYLKHLAHWIAVNILEKASLTQSIGTLIAGATAKKAVQTASAVSSVTSDAGVAGAAGFASVMAALPFPVNVAVAPGVMAGAIAATLSNLGLAAAEGGWDMVPAGGAFTMLHAREMVLPASIADAVRAGAGSASGTGGGEVHLHVHAVDASGVQEFFSSHSDKIIGVLRRAQREFRL